MTSTPRAAGILLTVILVLSSLGTLAGNGAADSHGTETETMIESRDDLTPIDLTICKPAGASAENPVPLIVHSHGWGGSKSGCSSFDGELNAGFAVVSFSQRGFGESGGEAHVQDPQFEVQDTLSVVDHMAQKDWILKDAPSDPVMGAIGGSYGGGYQTTAALWEETYLDDGTRFDALSPEITWNDLVESLAPNGVVRSVWVDALYAAGAGSVHDGIHQAFVYSMATGQLPDGTVPGVYNLVEDFSENGPSFYTDDTQLDIPILFGQGLTDNLFILNQGLDNFDQMLTDQAKADSYLIGYNNGHSLPKVLPRGGPGSLADAADPCSSSVAGGQYSGFADLRLAFLEKALMDRPRVMPSSTYNLATADNQGCLQGDTFDTATAHSFDLPLATPTAAGAPIYLPVQEGPFEIAGVPTLTGDLLAAGVDQRAFVGLAVGTTPADAEILSNNMMPVRSFLPGTTSLELDLAGVSDTVEEGQTLYLVLSATSDLFLHHGSRTAGGLVIQDAQLHLPSLS